MLADDLKILKDFFGTIPPAGNQINIIVIGNTADLKEEIRVLTDALREEIGIYKKSYIQKPAPIEVELSQEPSKRTLNISDEERKARSDRMKKIHENRKKKGEGK